MAILGISSATKIISVGLVDQGRLLAELTLSGKEAFTEDLILYIDKLIEQSGVSLKGIAATEGPGAYSGLRGGLATAKTLAQTLNLPIVGVSTLEAIAYNLIDIEGTILAVTDARADEFNFAAFTSKDKKLVRLTEDLVLRLDRIIELLSQVKGKLYLAGQIVEIYSQLSNTRITAIPAQPRGGSVAAIGENLIAEGKIPQNVLPRYSHLPHIREWH